MTDANAPRKPWDAEFARQLARDKSCWGLPMAVGVTLTGYCDGRTRETFVSQATLSRALGATDDGVRKALKRLVEQGHVELVSAGHGGRPSGLGRPSNASNRYRMVLRENSQTVVGEIEEKSPDDCLKIPRPLSENPPTSVPPIPLVYPTRDPVIARKAKTPLPGGVPTEGDLAWARERCALKAQSLDLADQAERFRDHHIAKHTTSADWSASWRTWIGNALDWTKPKATGTTDARPGGYSALGQQLSVLRGGAQ